MLSPSFYHPHELFTQHIINFMQRSRHIADIHWQNVKQVSGISIGLSQQTASIHVNVDVKQRPVHSPLDLCHTLPNFLHHSHKLITQRIAARFKAMQQTLFKRQPSHVGRYMFKNKPQLLICLLPLTA
jgi:hypothetical protein